jgi:hypothetical protein
MTPAIKMIIGDWYVDELGVPTREIRARDSGALLGPLNLKSRPQLDRPCLAADARQVACRCDIFDDPSLTLRDNLAIPDYQAVMLPLLKYAARGN